MYELGEFGELFELISLATYARPHARKIYTRAGKDSPKLTNSPIIYKQIQKVSLVSLNNSSRLQSSTGNVGEFLSKIRPTCHEHIPTFQGTLSCSDGTRTTFYSCPGCGATWHTTVGVHP